MCKIVSAQFFRKTFKLWIKKYLIGNSLKLKSSNILDPRFAPKLIIRERDTFCRCAGAAELVRHRREVIPQVRALAPPLVYCLLAATAAARLNWASLFSPTTPSPGRSRPSYANHKFLLFDVRLRRWYRSKCSDIERKCSVRYEFSYKYLHLNSIEFIGFRMDASTRFWVSFHNSYEIRSSYINSVWDILT